MNEENNNLNNTENDPNQYIYDLLKLKGLEDIYDKDKSIDEIIKITNVDKIMNNKNISFRRSQSEETITLSKEEFIKMLHDEIACKGIK